jgi:predicted AAA+ superfamily ATPase
MYTYVPRQLEGDLLDSISRYPVTALIGPRQCGKSTLARRVLAGRPDSLFLDLELPSDLRKLADPELFFNENADNLIFAVFRSSRIIKN